jgi:hypothetical protein
MIPQKVSVIRGFLKSICGHAGGTSAHGEQRQQGRFWGYPGRMPMTVSVERGTGEVKSAKHPSEIVYFTAAVGLLDDPLYLRALEKVQQLHVGAKVLSVNTLWTSAQDWRATYASVLADVTHVYILPYAGGVVGAGIYEEINYFEGRAYGSPQIRVFDDTLLLREPHGMLILENRTLSHFARIFSEREMVRIGLKGTVSSEVRPRKQARPKKSCKSLHKNEYRVPRI